MNTKIAIIALAVLGSCACGKKNSDDGPLGASPIPDTPGTVEASAAPRKGNSIVIGDEFFPHNPGRTWILRNEIYPERVTTISMILKDGALAMFFQKNHPDTYHGAEGTNNNLIWFLSDDRGWIYPGNTNGSESPDDIRVSRDTGKEVIRIWLDTTDPTPVCFLIRSGSFSVPSDARGTFKYKAQYSTGFTGWSEPGLWWVRWDLVSPDLLRIRFDETYSTNTSGIYEDWYLRRGVGLVGIRQWYDANRTSYRRGISSEVLPR
jgi:hypothetical protein